MSTPGHHQDLVLSLADQCGPHELTPGSPLMGGGDPDEEEDGCVT